MNALTVEQLAKLCEMEIKIGNGKKHILISNDDGGSGFHELFFAFGNSSSTFTTRNAEYLLPYGVDYEEAISNYIVLG